MSQSDTTLKKLQVILTGNTTQLQTAMDKAQKSTIQATGQMEQGLAKVETALKSVANVAAAYISVKALVNFSKSCIELGSDLTEVQNVVDVTFGDMSDKIDKFAKSAIKQFGLSEIAAKQYSSTMGAMLKSMGFTTSQAYDMSTTLTGLAGDIASFYNLTGDEAFGKLRAGISGETEPLKQLGINMSVANLQAYALAQGITKSYNAMTQAEQAALRYNYILSVTKDAQGDFANTSASWSNQVKILNQQFASLKANIGQGLIMAFTPVLKLINRVVERLDKLAVKFKVVMAILTGTDLNDTVSQSTSSVKDTATSMTDDLSGVQDASANATKSVNGMTKGLKEAEKTAKRFLFSFDEIHKLEENDNSEALTINTPTTDDTSVIEQLIPDSALYGLEDANTEIEDMNNGLGMSQEEIENLRQKLEPFIAKMGDLGDTVSKWWAEHSPAFVKAWNESIKPTLEHWAERCVELWEGYLKPLFGNIGEFVGALWENLKPFVGWLSSTVFDKAINALEDLLRLGGGLFETGAGVGNFIGAVGNYAIGNKDKADELAGKAKYQVANGTWTMLEGAGQMGAGFWDVFDKDGHHREAFMKDFENVSAWGMNQSVLDAYKNSGYNAGLSTELYGHPYYSFDGNASKVNTLSRDDLFGASYDGFSRALAENATDRDIYLDSEKVATVLDSTHTTRNVRLNPSFGW